jgi:hypothetical protein
MHAAGFFNKAARGLYQTTKFGLIATPILVPTVAASIYIYTKYAYPDISKMSKDSFDTLDKLDTNSISSLKEKFPIWAENFDKINDYVKKEASEILNVPQETIIVKVHPEEARTFHAPLEKDGTMYHIMHLGLADKETFESLVDYVMHNKPTYAPWMIKHEIAHGKFDHGTKKGYLAGAALFGGYLAMIGLLLKKGSLLSITQQSSTSSILLKTALVASLPISMHKLYTQAHNALSRKYEWEADNFAISQITDPEILEAAACMCDENYKELQKTGIQDVEHPDARDRAANLRRAAAQLRKEQATGH